MEVISSNPFSPYPCVNMSKKKCQIIYIDQLSLILLIFYSKIYFLVKYSFFKPKKKKGNNNKKIYQNKGWGVDFFFLKKNNNKIWLFEIEKIVILQNLKKKKKN